jgi:hypothetical protein
LKVLSIHASIPHQTVKERLKAGLIDGCGPCVPQLTSQVIDQTTRIVAQMGPEPFLDAIFDHPDFDVIVGGRAYDPSPYVAFSAYHAMNKQRSKLSTLDSKALGSLTHMGKILECGGQCSTPKSMGAIASIYTNFEFDVTPTNPASICTVNSVAAHTMYEKTRPDILFGPGGSINLTQCKYRQVSDQRSIRVSGAEFTFSSADGISPYRLKLEGARVAGYRSIFMGSFRDPILVQNVHTLLKKVETKLRKDHAYIEEEWDIGFQVYGSDGSKWPQSEQIMLIGEVLAQTQKTASMLANTARVWCVHGPYPGQKATSGNMGFGIGGKMEFEAGPCAEFSVYHLMSIEEGEQYAVAKGPSSTVNESGVHKQDCDSESRAKPLFRWTTSFFGRGSSTPAERRSKSKTATDSSIPVYQRPKPLLDPPQPVLQDLNPDTITTLGDLAHVFRSKNAGPYEITIDIMFTNPDLYSLVKSSDLLNETHICKIYGITREEIIWSGFFDLAMAFKLTVPRMRYGKLCASGGFLENDVHGSQQHVELMTLPLSEEIIQQARQLLTAPQVASQSQSDSARLDSGTTPAVVRTSDVLIDSIRPVDVAA